MSEPNILLLDVETAPVLAHVWRLFKTNVSLNQIQVDSHMLSWSAKWLDEKEIMYMDQSGKRDITDDKKLVTKLADLIRQADIIVTQNGRSFDEKVIKARMIIHGLKPIGGYKHFDTYTVGKKNFRFTSHKLEYMAKALNVKHRKLTTRKFDGHELWNECMKGNKKAWDEMKKYNALDVLVLEEIYLKMRPWDTSVNHDVYSPKTEPICTCGSTHFHRDGFVYTATGKFQRWECQECGRKSRHGENLLSKQKRASIHKKV